MNNKRLSVILLDIETSPLVGFAWGTYQQNVLKVLEPSKIISVAYKELGDENKIKVKSIADYKNYKKGIVDDTELIKEIWGVMDRADVIIAHHGDSFDIKKLNSRFVIHGLSAPSEYETVDTKKAASRYFKFDSNSLDNLGTFLGVGNKIANGGFDLWVRCMAGDSDAWKRMKDYNAQDVLLLERVYLKLRPFIANHPNLTLVSPDKHSDATCGTCLSNNVAKRGFSVTKLGRKQRYQCNDCGSWSTGAWKRNVTEMSDSADD